MYHFFSTILSHLDQDLGEHGSRNLKCSRKTMFKGILLSASLSGYQFLQVSDCVVLVAFYPHLRINHFMNRFFFQFQFRCTITKEGILSLSLLDLFTFFPNLSLQVISIMLVQKKSLKNIWLSAIFATYRNVCSLLSHSIIVQR